MQHVFLMQPDQDGKMKCLITSVNENRKVECYLYKVPDE